MEEKEVKGNGKNLAIIFGTTLMAVLGVSSITPAFPSIMEDLNLSETEVGMLITVFTLPGVFLTPVLGFAADRLDRKRVLTPSLLLFGIAGGICFFITDFTVLLILRFFQGIGASALGAISTILIGDIYSGTQRARIMGLNASVLSIGTAFYPLIGGALAMISWSHPFLLPWIAIPIGLYAITHLNNPEPKEKQTLQLYFKNAWKGIKDPGIYGVFITAILIFIILYGSYLTYFSTMLGRIYNATSFVIGLIMFSSSISAAVVASRMGILMRNFKKHNLVIAGFLFHFTSMITILVLDSLWLFIFPAIIFGMGNGLLIPSIHTLLAEKASMEMRGIIMSINGAMLRAGQTLGPPVIGLAFAFKGYEGAFTTGAVMALIGMLVGTFVIKKSCAN